MTDADGPENDDLEVSASAGDGPDGDDGDEGEESPLPWKWIAWGALALAVAAGLYFAVQSYGDRGDLREAERLIAAGRHAEAAELLGKTLTRSPDSGQALLLKMKAEFLRGNWREADKLALGHTGQTVKGELATEVMAIADRAHRAMRLNGEATQLFQRGELAKAEVLLAEAAGLYPESPEVRGGLYTVQGSLAFEKKDYAGFLQVAEKWAREAPDSPVSVALLASALSAQYAATGDAPHRERAEQTLERARQLSDKHPQARAMYDEYSERIRHRLQTREIIGRGEYDRRFRSAAAGK